MLINSFYCKVFIFVVFELCFRVLFFKFLIVNLILVFYIIYLCEDFRFRFYLLELFFDNMK